MVVFTFRFVRLKNSLQTCDSVAVLLDGVALALLWVPLVC